MLYGTIDGHKRVIKSDKFMSIATCPFAILINVESVNANNFVEKWYSHCIASQYDSTYYTAVQYYISHSMCNVLDTGPTDVKTTVGVFDEILHKTAYIFKTIWLSQSSQFG